MKESSEIIDKAKNDERKEIEYLLEYKEKKEKLIRELLKDKQANLEIIKMHIFFLAEKLALIGYDRLIIEGKKHEAVEYFYDKYPISKFVNELYKKYKIN